jgi:hypothetical protein
MKNAFRSLVLLMVFCLLLNSGSVASAAGKVLELRNMTTRTIWVAKSDSLVGNHNDLQWYSQNPGVWALWNVTEGGYLYYAFAKSSDPGQRETVFYAQLPYHQHYRWFWMVAANGDQLYLTADYERAQGRNPME